MGIWIDYTIEVTRGDAKEVKAFLCGHRQFRGDFSGAEKLAEAYDEKLTEEEANKVRFATKANGFSENIFDELASSHPDYEFNVTKEWEASVGGDTYKDFFANGKFIKAETVFEHTPSDAELAFRREFHAEHATNLRNSQEFLDSIQHNKPTT